MALFYRILNLDLCLESDSKEFLEKFDSAYNWFRVSRQNGLNHLNISAQLIDPKDCYVRTAKMINQQLSVIDHRSLKAHPSPISHASEYAINTIFSQLEDFLMLHAGVVEKNGKALILAGSSGIGKTTLVLKLLEQGFMFCSDDFCPVNKQTKRIYPFPRSVLRVKKQPGKGDVIGRKRKTPINMDQLPSGVSKEPSVPACIICLDPGVNGNDVCELTMHLKARGEKGILKNLADLEHVVLTNGGNGFSQWRVCYPKGQGLTAKIRGLLAVHQDGIWNVYREDRIPSDFNKTPILTSIPTHDAAFRLLKDLKQNSVFFEGKTGGCHEPGKLFMLLNQLLEGVPCYQLSAGTLEKMVDILGNVMEEGGW